MAQNLILKKFYASDNWKKLRRRLIAERGLRCARCGRLVTEPIELIGHHKIELTPENVNNPMISLNPELIELICFDCHNIEHKRFGYLKKITRNVYLIFGPPLSGKKTYVSQHMAREDIVVDMDILYQAVSLLPLYDKPNNLLGNVRGIHNLLLDNIKTRYGKWNNAFIIGGYADKYKREKVASDLSAEIIFCGCSKEECLRRLDVDEYRKLHKDEWEKYIDTWFEKYVE